MAGADSLRHPSQPRGLVGGGLWLELTPEERVRYAEVAKELREGEEEE